MKIVGVFVSVCLTFATTHPLIKNSNSCEVDVSCGRDPSYDMQNLKITLSPDPPVKGKDVTVTTSGTLQREVSGGTIKVVVKYGLTTVLYQYFNLCYLAQEVGRECPLPAGPLEFSVTTYVPYGLLGGMYHANVTGTVHNDGKLLCFQATCNV